MIKKHLITCTVIVVLFIISKLFICSVPAKKQWKNSRTIINFLSVKPSRNNSLKFADEEVPAQNPRTRRRLTRSAWRRNLNNLTSLVVQQKASNLFPVIEPILEHYGIPEDFKYIPLLESGFDNHIKSPKGAVGLWQFMPGTAREYGLQVSKAKDERMNVRKSTIAACRYLRELYTQFNSWTLAAAAFNGGSPRIQHAMNRANTSSYADMHLNAETGLYVYKLVAIKQALTIAPAPTQGGHELWAFLNPDRIIAYN